MAKKRTNRSIATDYAKVEKEMKELISESKGNFTLNPDIMKKRDTLKGFQKECTHLDEDGMSSVVDGRCSYCNKIM